MDIIFGQENAERLAEKYVVLELEPQMISDDLVKIYCVVPSEKIPLTEVMMIQHWRKLHEEFVQANKDANAKLCLDLAEYLIGKWGGELDEFYEIVCSRFALEQK